MHGPRRRALHLRRGGCGKRLLKGPVGHSATAQVAKGTFKPEIKWPREVSEGGLEPASYPSKHGAPSDLVPVSGPSECYRGLPEALEVPSGGTCPTRLRAPSEISVGGPFKAECTGAASRRSFLGTGRSS